MVKFADRMNQLQGSEIRELLKLTQQPDIISFAGGLNLYSLFSITFFFKGKYGILKEIDRETCEGRAENDCRDSQRIWKRSG